jgi:hypothetical protein
MASCLPLLLLSSSIPLTLHQKGPEPATTTERQPGSTVLKIRTVTDAQQPRISSPVPQYRRSNHNEHRRARSWQERVSTGTLHPNSRPSNRSRRTNSVPSSLQFPIVHDHWVGALPNIGDGNRNVPEPGRNTDPVAGIAVIRRQKRSGSSPLPARKASSQQSQRGSVGSSVSSASTLVIAVPSPTLQPATRVTSPFRSSLKEDGGEDTNAEMAMSELGTIHSDSAKAIRDRFTGIQLSTGHDLQSTEKKSMPSCVRSKSVSFAENAPHIIQSQEDVTLDNSTDLRRKPPWNGCFLIRAPPIAAQPRLLRQTSLPSVRGQAAGRSILRRNGLSQGRSRRSDSEGLHSGQETERLVRSTNQRNPRRVLSPPPMSSVPEWEAVHEERIDESTAPASSSLSVSLSSNIPDEASLTHRSTYKEKAADAPLTVIVTLPQTLESAPSIQQCAVRHWSMQGVGLWIRRSGVYFHDGRQTESDYPSAGTPVRNVQMVTV